MGRDAFTALKKHAAPPTFWRNVRIAVLLFIAAIAAWSNWVDRLTTTDWDEPLHVGIFPINAGGDETAARYIARLSLEDVAGIERFLNREAHRYGVSIAQPVRVELFG